MSLGLLMELTLYLFNCNWFVSYSIYFVLQFSCFSDGWLSLQPDDVAKGVATQIQIISPSAQIFKRHIYSSSTLAFNEKYTFQQYNIIREPNRPIFAFMGPSQVDGCHILSLDDTFEAVAKQMQTSKTYGKQRKLSKERKDWKQQNISA